MEDKARTVELDELVAKERIREVVWRRAKATDEGDVAGSLSCYHHGATESHEGFDGPVAEYLATASPALIEESPVEVCFHLVGNILVEVSGDSARAESRFLCGLTANEEGVQMDYWNSGRYLDDFAYRDGRWAITRRVCEYDWSRSDPPSMRWWERPAFSSRS